MAAYMGVEPSEKKPYYFISYNTEDAQRISPIVQALASNDVHVWYDFGIPYDAEWKRVIAAKIDQSEGVILLYTNNIIEKENSFVITEYEIARLYEKKIIVVLLDEIPMSKIPHGKAEWIIKIKNHHLIKANANSIDETIAELLRAVSANEYLKQDTSQEYENPVVFSSTISRTGTTNGSGDPSAEEQDNQSETELTEKEIIARNKARRIQIAKAIFFHFLGFLALSAIMFGINLLIRGLINSLLDSWFYPDGSKTIQDITLTNPISLIATGMLFLLPVGLLLKKGYEIDSPTLKILGILLFVLETAVFHLLPRIAVVLLVIAIIVSFAAGSSTE